MKADKNLVKWIESELISYNTNLKVLAEVEADGDISISSSVVQDTPRTITNKFCSSTENLALNDNKEVDSLKKSIKRVDIWLNYLSDEGKYIVKGIYVDGLSLNSIANRWDTVYSSRVWKNKCNKALGELCEICSRTTVITGNNG